MKSKAALILTSLFLALILSGCGKDEFPMNKITAEDFAVVRGADEQRITYEMKQPDLDEALGTALQSSVSPRSQLYDGLIVYAFPTSDVIQSFLITNANFQTTRGIGVGSTVEDVKKAYGDQTEFLVDTGSPAKDAAGPPDERNGMASIYGNLLNQQLDPRYEGVPYADLPAEQKEILDQEVVISFHLEDGYVDYIAVGFILWENMVL